MSAHEFGDTVIARICAALEDKRRFRKDSKECCCSNRTVSAVVTHPEHAKQSTMDALTTFFGSFLSLDRGEEFIEFSTEGVDVILTVRRRRLRGTTTAGDVFFSLF